MVYFGVWRMVHGTSRIHLRGKTVALLKIILKITLLGVRAEQLIRKVGLLCTHQQIIGNIIIERETLIVLNIILCIFLKTKVLRNVLLLMNKVPKRLPQNPSYCHLDSVKIYNFLLFQIIF